MAHLVAYRNRTNISGQHSNERISVHGGKHPNVRIFGSFAGSSKVQGLHSDLRVWVNIVNKDKKIAFDVSILPHPRSQSSKAIFVHNVFTQPLKSFLSVGPLARRNQPPNNQRDLRPLPPSLLSLSPPLPPLVVQSLSGGDQNGGGLSILLSHSLPSSPHALHWLHCIRFGVSLSERASCARRQRGCFCVVWSGRVAGRITVEDEKVSVLY